MEQSGIVQDGDAESPERETSYSTSGRWHMWPYKISAVFGEFEQPYPSLSAEDGAAMALDFSGTRLQVGFALRFRALFGR